MDHPLTAQHAELLTKAIQAGNNLREFLLACKRCDLPVDEMLADNQRMCDMCVKVKAEFFPRMP